MQVSNNPDGGDRRRPCRTRIGYIEHRLHRCPKGKYRGTTAPPSSFLGRAAGILCHQVGKNFLSERLARRRIDGAIEPAIGPDGMRIAVVSHNALIVAVLIASVGAGVTGALTAHG